MRRRRRPNSQAQSGLNLTSMLDITFVLLIALMVVAPALTHTMEVELPEAPAPQSEPEKPDPKELIIVSVLYGDAPEGPHPLFANKEPLASLDALRRAADRWARDESPLALEIDRRVPFGTYLQVAAALDAAGIAKYTLIYTEEAE